MLRIHRSKAGIHIVRKYLGWEESRICSGTKELLDLNPDVKWKKGRMRDRWKSPKREGISRYFGRSAGIPLLLSSFYPGTKLLFWRRLFKFWKPVVKTMLGKSSRLFCVGDWFFLIFHPHSWMVCIPALLHSNTYLIFSQVSLKSLAFISSSLSFLYLYWPSTGIFFNISNLKSCLLASLGLSSSFSSRPSHLLRSLLILFIFSLLFHWTAVVFPPTVWLSPRLLQSRYLFPISLSKTRPSLSGSLWTLFLRLSYSKWLIPSSFPKSFICFVRKRKEAFKKCPAFRVKFFSRVNLRAAQRDPGGVNEQKEWKGCFLWVEWGFEREDLCFIADYTATFFPLRNCRLHRFYWVWQHFSADTVSFPFYGI